MDPASVLSLVSSCISITHRATATIIDLHTLRDKYQRVAQTVDILIGKLNSTKAATDTLSSWLSTEAALRTLSGCVKDAFDSSLGPCQTALEGIQQHVAYVKNPTSTNVTFRGRVRHLWDEATVKEHVQNLDSQIITLNLLLQVIHM